MYKKIIIGILILSMMIATIGCTKATSKSEANVDSTSSSLEKIKEKGKIVLGTSADYPPYEFHKLINGKDEIVGFDIEIAKKIADDIGVELEIVDMKFDGLLAALVTNDVDFIVAGMAPTPERAETVDFSISYYAGKQKLIVRKDDAAKLKEPKDFKGLKIGVQKSTTQEDIAVEKFTESEIVGLSKITDLVLEINNNKIDGIILSEPVAEAYVAQNKNLYMAEVTLGEEPNVAVALNKGNKDLQDSINETLDKLVKEGSIDKLIQEATILAEQD
ncbi:transporter substrate-binding domain-containing protein [Tissierella praeacuta]|uniref:transporter substrate-binding domain-containing protein n=1 Tax=Tissierella praeacuta TaxID=43131 RepID=UPI003342DBA8